jgi:hypothetical protein
VAQEAARLIAEFSSAITTWYAVKMMMSRCAWIAAAAWCCACTATWLAPAAQPAPASRAAQTPIGDALHSAADAVPAKVRRYAERLLQRYDKNKDGRLQADEWSKMHGRPETADGNHDGAITLDELTAFIGAFGRNRRVGPENPIPDRDSTSESTAHAADAHGSRPERVAPYGAEGGNRAPSAESGEQPAVGSPPRATTFHVPKSRVPAGLPDWFLRRDLDGDGQLSLAEYAPGATPADIEQFASHDRNGDGFITARECLDALKPASRKGAASPGKSGKKSSGK